MRPLCLFLLLTPCLLHAGEGSFTHNNITLKYTDTGNPSGEPVLLIHGFAVNRGLQWTLPGVTRFLGNQYRVILFDNRGHGTSTRPKNADQYGMEMVHDIKRLMDHLNIKKAHLVGYSLGSFLTHKFAATYPERVKSIVLGGAGWLREGPATEVMDQISESLRSKKSLEPLFRALHPADARPIRPEAIESASKMALLINDADALAGVAAGMKKLTLSEDEVKNMKIPTYCIVGQRDPLIESARILEGQRPQLKMLYIPRADHMNCFELPEFREAVLTFLKEQP